MTFACAAASLSINCAWISRCHGQRPIFAILVSSIAMTAMRSLGERLEARTPKSYALRSRLLIRSAPENKTTTSATITPRNQSDLQKSFLTILAHQRYGQKVPQRAGFE